MSCYDSESRVVNGRRVEVSWYYDSDMRAPWEEHDGHGVVPDEHRKDRKRPEYRIMHEERGSCYFYDVQESMKRALKDGWGYVEIDDWMGMLSLRRKAPTKRMIAAHAVEQDFQHLRAWLRDEWHWCWINVKDCETGVWLSCGGFESTDDRGHNEYIENAVDEMWEDVLKALLHGEIIEDEAA